MLSTTTSLVLRSSTYACPSSGDRNAFGLMPGQWAHEPDLGLRRGVDDEDVFAVRVDDETRSAVGSERDRARARHDVAERTDDGRHRRVLTLRRVSGVPVGSKTESAGNAVFSKSSAGCGVSMPSMMCATHISFTPGRGEHIVDAAHRAVRNARIAGRPPHHRRATTCDAIASGDGVTTLTPVPRRCVSKREVRSPLHASVHGLCGTAPTR